MSRRKGVDKLLSKINKIKEKIVIKERKPVHKKVNTAHKNENAYDRQRDKKQHEHADYLEQDLSWDYSEEGVDEMVLSDDSVADSSDGNVYPSEDYGSPAALKSKLQTELEGMLDWTKKEMSELCQERDRITSEFEQKLRKTQEQDEELQALEQKIEKIHKQKAKLGPNSDSEEV